MSDSIMWENSHGNPGITVDGEDFLLHRKVSAEIDRLRAELEIYKKEPWSKTIASLRAELAEKDKRIAELQDVGTKSIVDLQRAEKRIAELEARQQAAQAALGIIPCSKCGGSGRIYASPNGEVPFDCNNCRGHGWVMEER